MKDEARLYDPLALTAYHEAGHAVMAHLCGQIVTTVEILGDAEHTGSVSCLRFLEEPPRKASGCLPTAAIEARILCLVAGIAAEKVVTGDGSWSEPEDDLDEAVRLSLRVVKSCERVLPLLEEARDHAVDLLSRHWPAVEGLAAMLLIHRRLERDQIKEFMDNQLEVFPPVESSDPVACNHSDRFGGRMTLATSRPVTRAEATTAAVTAVSIPKSVSRSIRDISER